MDAWTGIKRTHMCGEITEDMAGKEVVLTGWVHSRRDHGGLIFIDLRDRTGIIQLVFSPDVNEEAFAKADRVRSEYVVAAIGEVRRRDEDKVNPKIATGRVEVYVHRLLILNRAKTPPFYIEEDIDVDENVRLRYRYLDLRRPDMQRNLLLRHRVTKAIRDFLDSKGFWEIETPILTRSTPEGARDYLVPSRVNPGKFYALPQSPQLFKQVLMVAGVDRYFQIARCFRDEDLRADRQPEFTQVDLEMSFVERDDILDLMEEMLAVAFRVGMGVEITRPFPRLSYQEAMDRYGSDKPDLRYGLELIEMTDVFRNSQFKVFGEVARGGGIIKAINAKGCAHFSRKDIDDLTRFVANYGAKGLAYIVVGEGELKSPILKFFSEEEKEEVLRRTEAQPGDIIFFGADRPEVVYASLGALRQELARRQNLARPDDLQFVWVVDFPLLEYDDEEKRWVAIHHPFTAPKEEDIPLLDTDPGRVRSQAYDLVLNGVELGGGSIRIHRRDLQEKIFSLLGLGEEDIREKFGFLVEAFDYGAPPHGGIAFGLDRMIMLMAGRETIRDVIPFPKTQSAADLMTRAPSEVTKRQLAELHIKLDVAARKKSGEN